MFTTVLLFLTSSLMPSILAVPPHMSSNQPQDHTNLTYSSTCFYYSPGRTQIYAPDCFQAIFRILRITASADTPKEWVALPGYVPSDAMWDSGSCAVSVVAYGEPGHPYWKEVRDSFSPRQAALAAIDVVDNCVIHPEDKFGGRVQVGRGRFEVFVTTNPPSAKILRG